MFLLRYALSLTLFRILLFIQENSADEFVFRQTMPPNNGTVCPGGKLLYTCSAVVELQWVIDNSSPLIFTGSTEVNSPKIFEGFSLVLTNKTTTDAGIKIISSATNDMVNSTLDGQRVECYSGVSHGTLTIDVADRPANCSKSSVVPECHAATNAMGDTDFSITLPTSTSLMCVKGYQIHFNGESENVSLSSPSSTFTISNGEGQSVQNKIVVYTLDYENRPSLVPCIYNITALKAVEQFLGTECIMRTSQSVTVTFCWTQAEVVGGCLKGSIPFVYIVEFNDGQFSNNETTSTCYMYTVTNITQETAVEMHVTVSPSLPFLGLTGPPLNTTVNLASIGCFTSTSSVASSIPVTSSASPTPGGDVKGFFTPTKVAGAISLIIVVLVVVIAVIIIIVYVCLRKRKESKAHWGLNCCRVHVAQVQGVQCAEQEELLLKDHQLQEEEIEFKLLRKKVEETDEELSKVKNEFAHILQKSSAKKREPSLEGPELSAKDRELSLNGQELHQKEEVSESLRQKLKETDEELITLKRQIEHLLQKLSARERELNKAKEELNKAKEELNKAKEEQKLMRQKQKETNEELESMRQKQNGTDEELESMRKKQKETDEELKSMRQKQKETVEELITLKKKIVVLEQEVKTSQSKQKGQEETIVILEQEVETSQSKQKRQEETIAHFEGKLEEANERMNTVGGGLVQLPGIALKPVEDTKPHESLEEREMVGFSQRKRSSSENTQGRSGKAERSDRSQLESTMDHPTSLEATGDAAYPMEELVQQGFAVLQQQHSKGNKCDSDTRL